MTIRIIENDNHSVLVGSDTKRFHSAWGEVVKLPKSSLYEDLKQIAIWADKVLGESLTITFK